MLVISASAILARSLKGSDQNRLQLRATAIPLVIFATGLFVILSFRAMRVDNLRLQENLSEDLPLSAVNAIQRKGWSGPLYNDFNWGGFFVWSLRMPVSIDGRTNVYGSEKIVRSYATWNGFPGWDTDPDLVEANLIVAPVGSPLTQLLRLQPCLQAAYEDKLAVVFITRKASGSSFSGSVKGSFCENRQAP
jgi:hypothetical protein